MLWTWLIGDLVFMRSLRRAFTEGDSRQSVGVMRIVLLLGVVISWLLKRYVFTASWRETLDAGTSMQCSSWL